jgi:hypothetical protein
MRSEIHVAETIQGAAHQDALWIEQVDLGLEPD